jgi:hypothetical protein
MEGGFAGLGKVFTAAPKATRQMEAKTAEQPVSLHNQIAS